VNPYAHVPLAAMEVARAELRAGVMEVGGENLGPRVQVYQATVGIPPGSPWCAAFVYFCVDQVCRDLKLPNPLVRTGKVTTMFARCPAHLKTLVPCRGAIFFRIADDEADDTVDEPGRAKGPGHCGFADQAIFPERRIITIEGNTNAKGSRNGDRVAVRSRSFDYVNLGYIDLGRARPEPTA